MTRYQEIDVGNLTRDLSAQGATAQVHWRACRMLGRQRSRVLIYFSRFLVAFRSCTSNPSASVLIDQQQSPLSWYGGNMPTNGPSSWSAAVTDMNAWAAAGALNN